MDEYELQDAGGDDEKPTEVRVIKSKSRLKKKAGKGGFREADIKRAQTAIDECRIDFRPVASKLLGTLKEIIDQIKDGDVAPDQAADQLLDPILQLRAQGAMFNYPTYTEISTKMVGFLEELKEVDKDALSIINSFYQGAVAINHLEIHEPNHDLIKRLQFELTSACERHLAKQK